MAEGPDILETLRRDHGAVLALVAELERGGKEAPRQVLDDLTRLLSALSSAEFEQLYGVAAHRVGEEGHRMAKQFRLDHAEIEMDLYRLHNLAMGSDEFDAELAKLIGDVRRHLEDEETVLVPSLQAAVPADELGELGQKFVKAKDHAPVRPHPSAPKSALGSRLVARLLGPWERWRDGSITRR